MKIIDLTHATRPHHRWQVKPRLALDFAGGAPYRSTVVDLPMHSFTHVDAPLHVNPGGGTIDEVPLESICGEAAILDLTHKAPGEEITPTDLTAAGACLVDGDIIIIKTCWDMKRDIEEKAFWSDAPYIGEEAAAWLAAQPVKAVGFDFPQDRVIREIPVRHPPLEEMPTHRLLLAEGIYLVEYLANLSAIQAARCSFFAAPLKMSGAEGAPARAFALLED